MKKYFMIAAVLTAASILVVTINYQCLGRFIDWELGVDLNYEEANESVASNLLSIPTKSVVKCGIIDSFQARDLLIRIDLNAEDELSFKDENKCISKIKFKSESPESIKDWMMLRGKLKNLGSLEKFDADKWFFNHSGQLYYFESTWDSCYRFTDGDQLVTYIFILDDSSLGRVNRIVAPLGENQLLDNTQPSSTPKKEKPQEQKK